MLPDKHVVKMSLESCQMISIVYSHWYFNWGTIPKVDGTPYSTKRGVFKNHPCTKWVAEKHEHLAWLLVHAQALCDEYTFRYNKVHACSATIETARNIFYEKTGLELSVYEKVETFQRVMIDEIKNDMSIDVVTAYQRYVCSKSWVVDNYIKKPERKPLWILE